MNANELASDRREGGADVEDDLVVDADLRWKAAIMSLHHSADPPTQTETLNAFEALVRLKERFGLYDESTNVLLGLAVERFMSAFGDDDWHTKAGAPRPNTVTLLRAVAG